MTELLKNKIAIVTGASSGIGKGIARILAREGADVLITYRSNKAGIDRTVEELAEYKTRIVPLQADVSRMEDIDKIFQTAMETFGRIDILVNNAGITNKYPFLEITEEEYDNIFAINCKGTYFCMQGAARIMIKQNYGKIINISSLTIKASTEHFTSYSATKAAISKFTEVAAMELAQYNIRINAIAAGWIPVGDELKMSKEEIEKKMYHIPIKRFGTPEDIGELTVFLASDRSDYISGETVVADGGQSTILSLPSVVRDRKE